MREPFDPNHMQRRIEPDTTLDQLAHEVIGAAIEVHRMLGPGFMESAYEEALCMELELRGLPYQRQVRFAVTYKGKPVSEGRIDLLVAGILVIELKAVELHNPLYECQLRSYLKATNLRLGLLINFNVPVLKNGIRRVINS